MKRMVVTVSVPDEMDDLTLARLVNQSVGPDADATAWEWPLFWVDVAEGVVSVEGEAP